MESDTLLVVISLSVITLLTTLLNGSVIMVILTTQKLQIPANYLICSLAVTDFLLAILVMPLSVLSIAAERWLLGSLVCEAWLSVDMTCCTCSILHLCVIALDRHRAIANALEYACKRTPRNAAIMVSIVWVISCLISVPPLFWRHGGLPDDDIITENYTQCVREHNHVGYTIYSTFGAFYIPLALMLVLYYRIFREAKMLYHRRKLSGTPSALANTARGQSSVRGGGCGAMESLCACELSTSDPELHSTELNRLGALNTPSAPGSVSEAMLERVCEKSQICLSRERRAARVLGFILGAFVLCWLPFFVKELLVGLRVLQVSPQVSDFLTWLGYVNSLVNPLVYTSFNQDFRESFQKLYERLKKRQ